VAEIPSQAIRSIVTDDEFGGFRITIPGTGGGRCALGCGITLWIIVLALTLLYIASDPTEHFSGGIAFLPVWALIGLVLGLGAAHAWTSREVVMIEGNTLVLRGEIAGFSRDRTFDLEGVTNLRPGCFGQSSRRNAVAFEHGGRTHHFGIGLSEHEVVRLVKTIRSRFPIRDDWSDAEPLPIIT
jgi:hypothetical protein